MLDHVCRAAGHLDQHRIKVDQAGLLRFSSSDELNLTKGQEVPSGRPATEAQIRLSGCSSASCQLSRASECCCKDSGVVLKVRLGRSGDKAAKRIPPDECSNLDSITSPFHNKADRFIEAGRT